MSIFMYLEHKIKGSKVTKLREISIFLAWKNQYFVKQEEIII